MAAPEFFFFFLWEASRGQNAIMRGQKSNNLPKMADFDHFFSDGGGGKWEQSLRQGDKCPQCPPLMPPLPITTSNRLNTIWHHSNWCYMTHVICLSKYLELNSGAKNIKRLQFWFMIYIHPFIKLAAYSLINRNDCWKKIDYDFTHISRISRAHNFEHEMYDMIWYDMIWYDMIWYDMIWYDMIWYDMIW